MKFEVYDLSFEDWNKVVKSFDNYGVHYLKEYVEAFTMDNDEEPLLFYYEGDNNRGINVVLRRDVAKDKHFKDKIEENKYFDFSTPYGYGGWIFDNESGHDECFSLYLDWCNKNNILCEFVRFTLFDRPEDYYGITVPRVLNVVRNLEDSFENIEKDFERRVRKDLKTTGALKIIVDEDGKYLDDFLGIYYSTMDRRNAEDEYYFSKEFYEKINTMKGNFVYFHVLLDEKIISTELVIMDKRNMYSYLGGTYNDYFSYHPNHFIKYHIIKWGVEHGYKNFVLGGGYGTNDGIFNFKKGFAPEGIVQFYTGQKILNEELYNELTDMRIKEGLQTEGNMYFPLYRAG
ncbi:MAG: GNAT family N-acetyltransferase [Erysipelotrichaceae bacterium]|nr:GNAT family N-acetyltransferase [Erysipelotrichaceae bacterium]